MDTVMYRNAEQINSAMGRVYGHMSLAVITSMIVSYLVGTNAELMALLFGTALKWVVIFAPLVAIIGVAVVLNASPTKPVALLCLHGFAALMGLSMATIFAVFTMASIIEAFMGGAVLFSVMSFYGYFTKRSLDSIGSFLFVGLIAIIIASIINIFVGSSLAQMVISAIAILIFLGFTAYDTQKIREEIYENTDTSIAEIRGALTLYMDFINLFINLLNLFGERK